MQFDRASPLKTGRTVTQDAFMVAPQVLGLPLAGAARRGIAMVLDLLLVVLLVRVGGLVFGLAVAWVFLRAASGRMGNLLSPTVRTAFRAVAAGALFLGAMVLWRGCTGPDEEEDGDRPRSSAVEASGGEVAVSPSGLRQVMASAGVVGAAMALDRAATPAQADSAAGRMAAALLAAGMDSAEAGGALRQMARDREPPTAAALATLADAFPRSPAAADSAAAASDSAAAAADSAALAGRADVLAAAYAEALRGGDTARAAGLRPRLAALVAADTLEEMEERIGELREDRDELRREREAAEERAEEAESAGLLHLMARVADELGIGLGWVGLYFTAFLALWKGQTPGKRVMGIRVVRLNGLPISLWASFERFGGYAASIFTGLLGFFQILWDRNRQALHDKLVETVVVRVVPGMDEPAPRPPRR